VGNEENVYPVPDLNKIMINVTKELCDAHKKKPLKKKSRRKSEKLLKKILDMVNQNIQDALKIWASLILPLYTRTWRVEMI
jgi:hypothetical protein